jgi:hypothetical protein
MGGGSEVFIELPVVHRSLPNWCAATHRCLVPQPDIPEALFRIGSNIKRVIFSRLIR